MTIQQESKLTHYIQTFIIEYNYLWTISGNILLMVMWKFEKLMLIIFLGNLDIFRRTIRWFVILIYLDFMISQKWTIEKVWHFKIVPIERSVTSEHWTNFVYRKRVPIILRTKAGWSTHRFNSSFYARWFHNVQ